MSGARNAADGGGDGDTLAAIIAAAVDAFLREESAESAADGGTRTKISAWRMAARTAAAGIGGARGYGAGGGWRGIG